MHNRVDILRVPPAPLNSPMFVYYSGTETQIPIFRDKNCTKPHIQPIRMNTENIHFYCENTVRVDIKILSEIYTNGFILIEDQLMVNQDTYLDRILTLTDTNIIVDNNGNLLVEEI